MTDTSVPLLAEVTVPRYSVEPLVRGPLVKTVPTPPQWVAVIISMAPLKSAGKPVVQPWAMRSPPYHDGKSLNRQPLKYSLPLSQVAVDVVVFPTVPPRTVLSVDFASEAACALGAPAALVGALSRVTSRPAPVTGMETDDTATPRSPSDRADALRFAAACSSWPALNLAAWTEIVTPGVAMPVGSAALGLVR